MSKRVVMTCNGRQTKIDPDFCEHNNIIYHTTGGQHYNGRDQWDDIKTVVVCSDCGLEWDLNPIEEQEEIPY